jgi:polyhydroxybutyrate depolymerase
MAHRTLTVAMVLLVVAIFWVSSTVLDRADPETSSLVSNAEVAATLDEKPKPTLKRFGFTVNGQERTAALHVPKGASTAKPMPLFVIFHGGKDSTARAITNNWSSMFDQGVLLVFPNGQRDRPDDPAWNVDDPTDMQDVDLTRELLRVLEREYSVDPKRRYIAGFSNGGMQTMMLMCHASELFAGAAVVH